MNNTERKLIIINSIKEYKKAKTKEQKEKALNGMKNVYTMCCLWQVKGILELQTLIREADKEATHK